MLAVWRAWGVEEPLRGAWQSGVVLAGRLSAASIRGLEHGVADVEPADVAAHERALDARPLPA